MKNPLLRLITANRDMILAEARQMSGFMRLLMKQRNAGEPWTPSEKKELKAYLKRLSAYMPVLIVFLLPGGSLLIPVLAGVLDVRKARRAGGTAHPSASGRPVT